MWARHGHTQCVRNTHLLRDLEHALAIKDFKIIHSERLLLRPFSATNTILQTYWYARFLHYFYAGTSNFNVGTGPGMPGCSYTTDRMGKCRE